MESKQLKKSSSSWSILAYKLIFWSGGAGAAELQLPGGVVGNMELISVRFSFAPTGNDHDASALLTQTVKVLRRILGRPKESLDTDDLFRDTWAQTQVDSKANGPL